jgi:hypothetical protein
VRIRGGDGELILAIAGKGLKSVVFQELARFLLRS